MKEEIRDLLDYIVSVCDRYEDTPVMDINEAEVFADLMEIGCRAYKIKESMDGKEETD